MYVGAATSGGSRLLSRHNTMSIHINHTAEQLVPDGTHYGTIWVPASGLAAPPTKPATFADYGDFGAWEFADNQEQ